MNAEHYWMDQGIQTFRMKLVPHTGTWKENDIARITEEFIAPAVSIYQGIHGGKLPKSGSFLSVNKAEVIVTSIKHAENSDDIIIRMVETSGSPVTAALDLKFVNLTWSGNFGPCEIKTIRLNLKSKKITETNLLEEAV
jgi:alpha-mannosidase